MDKRIEEVNNIPLGIMPEEIWLEKRILDLEETFKRYKDANHQIPLNWLEEHSRHQDNLKKTSSIRITL